MKVFTSHPCPAERHKYNEENNFDLLWEMKGGGRSVTILSALQL